MSAPFALLLVASLAGSPEAPVADTIVDLQPGDRIVLDNLSGRVAIEAWDSDRLEVRYQGRPGDLTVRRSGKELRVDGPARRVDAVLRVPAWAEVGVEGIELDVRIQGLSGHVRVRTVTGEVRVSGTSGRVEVRTVAGDIVATSTTGDLLLAGQGDDVRVSDATGTLDVRTGAGDLVLERIRSPSVRAEAQAGDIRFSGALDVRGTYAFFVHAGDIVLEMPEDTRADVRMATFDGELRSDFPVVVPSYRSGRAIEFALGGGGASVRIEVFSGEVSMVRSAG